MKNTPPTIHQTATLAATSGCSMVVSSESRAPPEPPAITAGAMSSRVSSSARVSARMCDSERP